MSIERFLEPAPPQPPRVSLLAWKRSGLEANLRLQHSSKEVRETKNHSSRCASNTENSQRNDSTNFEAGKMYNARIMKRNLHHDDTIICKQIMKLCTIDRNLFLFQFITNNVSYLKLYHVPWFAMGIGLRGVAWLPSHCGEKDRKWLKFVSPSASFLFDIIFVRARENGRIICTFSLQFDNVDNISPRKRARKITKRYISSESRPFISLTLRLVRHPPIGDFVELEAFFN